MSSNKSRSTPPIVSIISGGIAGGVGSTLLYPLEFIKTRVQLRNDPSNVSRNPFSIVSQVYKKEGLKALYKGCGPLIVGSIGRDAVRFSSYDIIKDSFRDPDTGVLSPGLNLFAGISVGVITSVFPCTPSERIKTALIDDARAARRYCSTSHCVRSIIKEDGLVGLYRGFIGTTLKQASVTAFKFCSYNTIKELEVKRDIPQNAGMNFINGAAAGLITTLGTQPMDTIKTRSQSSKVTTTAQAVLGIMKDGGVRGFWSGTFMRLSRTVFSYGVIFSTAEAIAKILNPVFARERASNSFS